MLRFCGKYNQKINPGKWILFSSKIRWCDILISEAGVRYDPGHPDGQFNMELLKTSEHLQQISRALQWVKIGLPTFTSLIVRFHNFMEKVNKTSGKRTILSGSQYKISTFRWEELETTDFGNCKHGLSKQVTSSHPDTPKFLCVYTDFRVPFGLVLWRRLISRTWNTIFPNIGTCFPLWMI